MKHSNTKNNPAKFTSFPSDTNWVSGICSGYSFVAKLFDDGSEFGINEGRVSKLEIKNSNNITVVNFDRGWDIEVNDKDAWAYESIMELLENSDKRFEEGTPATAFDRNGKKVKVFIPKK